LLATLEEVNPKSLVVLVLGLGTRKATGEHSKERVCSC
jgi:hypothetical protein